MSDKERVSPKQKAAKAFDGSQGVEIHSKGARLWSANRVVPNPTAKGGGKRGTIGGWSAASRRRMRDWMLSNQAPEGWEVWSVTLTIPGEPVHPEEAKRIFKNWCLHITSAGGGALWRLEVQKRDQLHWHCIVTLPPDRWDVMALGREYIIDSWHKCLDTLEPCLHPINPKTGKRKKWQNPQTGEWLSDVLVDRSEMNGAQLHAVAADPLSKAHGISFERYLMDHASKAKQEQIAYNVGRHWGVIGRKVWVENSAELHHLSEFQWHALRRAYERLCSPVIQKAGVPFGKSVQHRQRARRGSLVTFTTPATMGRLVEWASTLQMDRDQKPSRNPQRFNSGFQAAIKGVTTQKKSGAVCNDSSPSCEGSEQGQR